MSRIKIKNFGPIKEGFKEILADGTDNEWMDIKKVTMFIGNQGRLSQAFTLARQIEIPPLKLTYFTIRILGSSNPLSVIFVMKNGNYFC